MKKQKEKSMTFDIEEFIELEAQAFMIKLREKIEQLPSNKIEVTCS